MKPVDITENNQVITPEQVEKPVGCGGTCGGKCGSGNAIAQMQCGCGAGKSCCMKKCCCCMKVLLRVIAAALLFYVGYLYGQTR